jgi:hypothetical protein
VVGGTSGAPIGGAAGANGATVVTTEGAGMTVGLGGAATIPGDAAEFGGFTGGARNSAFAKCASIATSGQGGGNGSAPAVPAGMPGDGTPTADSSGGVAFRGSGVLERILMILADVDLIEHTERVVGEHGERAVERDQVGRDRLLVDAHEAHR